MNHTSTLFLRSVIFLIGLFILSLCVFGIPRVIGNFQLGGYDPILLGLYIPALPFFYALYHALRLLGYIDKNHAFSLSSIKSFRTIKYCAVLIGGLFSIGLPYIFYVAEADDAPGVIALALVIIFTSFVIGTFAAVLQKLIQNAVDIKSENDLTV